MAVPGKTLKSCPQLSAIMASWLLEGLPHWHAQRVGMVFDAFMGEVDCFKPNLQTNQPTNNVMAIIKRNDTNNWMDFQNEMKTMFDRFFSDEDNPLALMRNGERVSDVNWSPRVDISENENNFFIHAELPGMNKDDISVNIDNGVLTIEGEREHKTEDKEDKNGRKFHRVERSYGKFQRSFRLPNTVEQSKIEASFNDGVLDLTIPKAEEAKPKQIEVKVQ